MVASSYKANGVIDKELEEELMKFTTNYEENKAEVNLVEEMGEICRNADVEVDIMECTNSSDNETVEEECLDSTESSSSFEDCDYRVDALSDSYVDTASTMDFDGFDDLFRRKRKLTNHWRAFITPLMWRCKWVELQIKKFDAEAQKYDRELEKYRQQKMVRLEKFTEEDLGVKSIPFSENYFRNEVFMRKKRRRIEATEDVAEYMSHHNLFSYFENGGCFTKGGFMDIDLMNHAKATRKVNIEDEFWDNDDLFCIENGDDDNLLENVFRKIDILQSRVGELKSRADKITNENAEKFSCPDNLIPPVLDDGFDGSHLNNDDPSDDLDGVELGNYIVSQLIAEYKLSEFLVPENAVKSYEGVVCGDTNARTDRVYFADPTQNEDYGTLIDNPRMKEMNNFEELKIQPIQKPVLVDSNRLTDDQRPSDLRSILKTTNQDSKSKRGRNGQRVRFVI